MRLNRRHLLSRAGVTRRQLPPVRGDQDTFEVLGFERGPWLDGDDETDVEVVSTIDEERGNATIEQSREPKAGGTTGTDVLVDLGLRIDDDAAATGDTGAGDGVVGTDGQPGV